LEPISPRLRPIQGRNDGVGFRQIEKEGALLDPLVAELLHRFRQGFLKAGVNQFDSGPLSRIVYEKAQEAQG
jgi:hypothetical protein